MLFKLFFLGSLSSSSLICYATHLHLISVFYVSRCKMMCFTHSLPLSFRLTLQLNAAAFPTSCLPCWHMEGLSRSALFALWHSTEFVEEQRCTRTRAELEPNRKSQTSETFTILCFDTRRRNQDGPLSAVSVKATSISQQIMANTRTFTSWNVFLSPNPPNKSL